MSGLDAVLAAVAAAFEGDADDLLGLCVTDVVFCELPGEPACHGVGETAEFFTAFGGRRERFLRGRVVADGDVAALEYAVAFRADAGAYGQHGMAMLELRDGLLASWHGVWVETRLDLTAWEGD